MSYKKNLFLVIPTKSRELSLAKDKDFIKGIKSTNDEIIYDFLKGGYPEPRLEDDVAFHRRWMENYYQTYINRDVKRLFPKLDSLKYRRFIDILASLSGTIINKASVGRSLDTSV